MIALRTVRSVLDDAALATAWPADIHDTARAALQQADREHLPWYLRVLMGGAAWLGALFLLSTVLGLIALILGERVDAAAVAVGAVLIPAGIWLHRAGRGELARQAALVAVFAGQSLCIGGIGAASGSTTLAALVALALSIALIVAFDEGVYRFCATLAIVGSLLAIAHSWQLPFTLGIGIAATAVVPLAAWRGGAHVIGLHHVLDPVAWGSIVAMCGLLLAQTLATHLLGPPRADVMALLVPKGVLAAILVALLAWLAVRVARDHGATGASTGHAVALGVVLAVGLITVPTPAVSGALLIVVLGFDRQRTGVVALGGAFLVVFLGLYYYNLSLTLLQKAIVLVASGLICIGASAYFAGYVGGRRQGGLA